MTQSNAEDRVLLIKKLLAKAERTDNEAERDAYTAKATELMIQWGIEEATLQGDDRPKDEIVTQLLFMNVPKSFSHEYTKIGIQVANALGGKGLFQRKADGSTVPFVVAYASDLVRITMLTESLILQCSTALATWWRKNSRFYASGTDRFNAKRSFITGFASGVKVRLTEIYKATVASAGHGAELVLFDRTKQVASWLDTHLNVGSVRPRNYHVEGHGAGHSAGLKANVGQTNLGGGRAGIAR